MSRVLSNENHSEIGMQFTDNTDKVIKVEMTILVNKLLSLVDQTKKDLNMSRWIHMPRHCEEYRSHGAQKSKLKVLF